MRLSIWRTWCYFEAQYMRLTTWRTRCYFEAQVWKIDSSIALFIYFLLFFFFSFFIYFFVWSLIPTCGGIIVSIILSSLGQCSNIEDHHTFIYLQLKNYNSILRTKYDSIWMPPAVDRDVQWIKSDMYERIMNGGFATNTMSTTWSCKAIWQ